MKNQIVLFYILLNTTFVFSQKFSTDKGDINNIKGINEYNIVFEYATDLEIPNYNSEKDFLEFQVNKREKKEVGTGEAFKKLWFENRKNIYEPKFIEKFNAFRLKKRQVTVSADNTNSEHTMVIKVLMIYPGYDVVVYEEEAKLEVTITIYKNGIPENILYSTKAVRMHGYGKSTTEYERVLTAYAELGRGISKYFCRKT